MDNPNDGDAPVDDQMKRSVAILSEWIIDNTDLLLGVWALRGLGEPAAQAVESVMKVKHLETTRLSWELWEHLAINHGVDTDSLLEDHIPPHLLRLAHAALRGADVEDVDVTAVMYGAALRHEQRPQLRAITGEGIDDGNDRSPRPHVRVRLHGPKRTS
jgi:hypothetical protein